MQASERRPGVRVATVAGVPIYVGGSWALIAVLLVALIGPSIAASRPDLGILAYGVAAVFAVQLLVAVLVHEAAHAVAARRYGLPVLRVVADLWGGHTAFEAGRTTPRSAAVIAVVGPLANGAMALLSWLALPAFPTGIPHTLVGGFALLNAALAGFNLLPGLPLDGGQLVESAVWKATGSRNRGMVVAGWCGRAVTAVVVLYFVVRPLVMGRGIDIFDIAWSLFIASFMWAGATAAIRGGEVLEALGRVSLRGLLRPVVAVPSGASIGSVHGQPGSTVVVLDETGAPFATVGADDVRQVPTELWETTPVSAVCRPQPRGWAVEADPQGDVLPVVIALQEARVPVAVVLQGGRALGVVRAVDVNEAVERN